MKTDYKVLGKPSIYKGDIGQLERYRVHYRTKLMVPISNEGLVNLDKLGCAIHSFNTSSVELTLPEAWTHIHINKHSSMVTDLFGRVRIRINNKDKKIVFSSRFGYEMTAISRKDSEAFINVAFTDAGVPLSRADINLKDYVSDIEDLGDMFIMEHVYTKVIGEIERTLYEQFPDWKNPASYWDMEVSNIINPPSF